LFHDIENYIKSDIHLYAYDTVLVESYISLMKLADALALLNRYLQKLDAWNINFKAKNSVYTTITCKCHRPERPLLLITIVISGFPVICQGMKI